MQWHQRLLFVFDTTPFIFVLSLSVFPNMIRSIALWTTGDVWHLSVNRILSHNHPNLVFVTSLYQTLHHLWSFDDCLCWNQIDILLFLKVDTNVQSLGFVSLSSLWVTCTKQHTLYGEISRFVKEICEVVLRNLRQINVWATCSSYKQLVHTSLVPHSNYIFSIFESHMINSN